MELFNKYDLEAAKKLDAFLPDKLFDAHMHISEFPFYGKDYFGFIRQTNAPAVLCEFAFLDNKTDVKIVDTVAEQKEMGVAAAKGFLKTLGIKWQEPAKYTVTVSNLSKAKADALVEKLKKDGYSVSVKKS